MRNIELVGSGQLSTKENLHSSGLKHLISASAHTSRMSGPQAMAALKKRPKYGVSDPSKRTYNGVVYHSAAEAKHAMSLDLKQRAGVIVGWQRQVPFVITVGGQKICKVVVDFAVHNLDGTTIYEEIKGVETPAYTLQAKLLKACYPDIDYRVLKVRR